MSSREPEIFQAAISCDVVAGYGTQYPCSDRDILDTYQFSHHNEHPFISTSRATRELIDHNDLKKSPSSHERDAIARLVSALNDAGAYQWNSNLIIKAFVDPDTVFFDGVLRGNVRVVWEDPDDWVEIEQSDGDITYMLGITLDVEPGHALILLNAESVFLASNRLNCFRQTHVRCYATWDVCK